MEFKNGLEVIAPWSDGNNYPARILSKTAKGYKVLFYEYNEEYETQGEKIKKAKFQKNEKVVVNWDNGKEYRGTIRSVFGYTCTVEYNDGDIGQNIAHEKIKKCSEKKNPDPVKPLHEGIDSDDELMINTLLKRKTKIQEISKKLKLDVNVIQKYIDSQENDGGYKRLTVELPSTDCQWGFSISLNKHWSEWKLNRIERGKQAKNWKLKEGDKITMIDGLKIDESNMRIMKEKILQGDSCRITFLRCNNQEQQIKNWCSNHKYRTPLLKVLSEMKEGGGITSLDKKNVITKFCNKGIREHIAEQIYDDLTERFGKKMPDDDGSMRPDDDDQFLIESLLERKTKIQEISKKLKLDVNVIQEYIDSQKNDWGYQSLTVEFKPSTDCQWGLSIPLNKHWSEWKLNGIERGKQAENLKLKEGDKITMIDGLKIDESNMKFMKEKLSQRDSCRITFLRCNQEEQLLISKIKNWCSNHKYRTPLLKVFSEMKVEGKMSLDKIDLKTKLCNKGVREHIAEEIYYDLIERFGKEMPNLDQNRVYSGKEMPNLDHNGVGVYSGQKTFHLKKNSSKHRKNNADNKKKIKYSTQNEQMPKNWKPSGKDKDLTKFILNEKSQCSIRNVTERCNNNKNVPKECYEPDSNGQLVFYCESFTKKRYFKITIKVKEH